MTCAVVSCSPEKIVVLLYPNQAFRDITRSPSWAGALNDGKIRVPVSGLNMVNPQLAHRAATLENLANLKTSSGVP